MSLDRTQCCVEGGGCYLLVLAHVKESFKYMPNSGLVGRERTVAGVSAALRLTSGGARHPRGAGLVCARRGAVAARPVWAGTRGEAALRRHLAPSKSNGALLNS